MLPLTFGQRWIRPRCRHTDTSTQPYTSGAQTLLQHAHRDAVSDRNCNLIHTPSSKFAGAVRAPVKSCMRNSVQSTYFSLIAGEGEERKQMLSTAEHNKLATGILKTLPWGLPALKFRMQLQSRPGEELVCCPVARKPMHMVSFQNKGRCCSTVATNSDLQQCSLSSPSLPFRTGHCLCNRLLPAYRTGSDTMYKVPLSVH